MISWSARRKAFPDLAPVAFSAFLALVITFCVFLTAQATGLQHAITVVPFTHVLIAGADTLSLRFRNLRARSIDLLYSLDGKKMPVLYGWQLDEHGGASVFSAATPLAECTATWRSATPQLPAPPPGSAWTRPSASAGLPENR